MPVTGNCCISDHLRKSILTVGHNKPHYLNSVCMFIFNSGDLGHPAMSTGGIWLSGHRGVLLVWCVAGSLVRGWESLRKRVGLAGENSWHPQIC